MAFTLASHIILVPLGVSWAFMTLVANYRAIKRDDTDTLLLAQRWSKYMAVTFAVGAVSGTVLSFEFGLLWPNFMGKYGAPRPISEPTATATPAGAQAMTTVLGALMIVTLAAVGRRRRTRSATR